MKKRTKSLKSILCGISLPFLMLGGMASAQEILNESFTSDNLPEGWTSIVGEDGSHEWTGYSYGYGPDYETGHAELYPGYEGVNNAWLITPMLEPSAENHILTFWISNVWYDCDFDATRMKLRVSTASLDTNDFTNTLATYLNTEIQADFPCTYNGEDWAKKSVDLTDFIGQKIYIAFQVLDNSLVDVGLDEVSGIPLFAYDNDASIESIDVIAEDFVQIGTDVRLRAIVKNKGKNKNPVTVSFSVDGIPVGSQRIDFASNPDTAYLDYSFENTGTYTVKASLPDDDDASNNTHETKVDVYPANFLFEDFHADSPFPPENWQFAVTNGNVDFSNEDYEGTGGALSTPGYLQIPYDYITASEDNPSISYSITPQLRPSPEYHTLSFYVQLAGSPYGEGTTSFEVLLSETTASTEDFAIQLAQYEATENEADLDAYEWAYREIDLTDYIGKDVYVAFRVEDPGLSSWYVDEVKGLPLSIFEKDARVRMLALEDPYRYYFSGDEIRLKAIVDNPGLENLDGLHVELQVNGQAADSRTLELASGEVSDTLSFTFEPEKEGLYTLSVQVPADDNASNDKQAISLQVYPENYLLEGFESGLTPPEYWDVEYKQIGLRTEAAWNAFDMYPKNGKYSVTSNSAGYRLITPRLTLTGKDSLCFHAKSALYDDTVSLCISLSKDMQAWDTVTMDTIIGNEYRLHKIMFAEMDPEKLGEVFLAFSLASSGTCYIDDIHGPMMSPKDDQFAIRSAWAEGIIQAGTECRIAVALQNDGTLAQAKEISLYVEGRLAKTLTSETLSPGQTDTLHIPFVFEEENANTALSVRLPEDVSLVDNQFDFNACIYPQTLPWRLVEGFESADAGFWQFGENWAPYQENAGWGPAGHPAYEGENYMQWSSEGYDTVLALSPYLDLRYDEYELSLAMYRSSERPGSPDRLDLGLSETGRWEDVLFVDSIHRYNNAYPVTQNTGWQTYSFIIPVQDMEKGFLVLRTIGSYSWENIDIDNIVLKPHFPQDAEIAAMVLPTDTVWGADSARNVLQIRLLNSGYENLESAELIYGVDSIETGRVKWKGMLLPGQDTLIMLTENLCMARTEAPVVFAEVIAAGDSNMLNNRIEKSLSIKQAYELPFVANFEDSAWNKDWQNFTLSSDGLTWRLIDTAEQDLIKPIFGKNSIFSASFDDNMGPVTPDNWFVTPGLAITHPKAWLSFYVQAADATDFKEAYQILVSTRSDRDTAFFTPVYADTLESDELQHVVLPLDGYKGEVLNIAFRHFNCSGQYRLLLDSVHVYYPELFEVTATVNPTEAGTVEGIGEYILDEEVVLMAVGNEGWKFSGWYQGGDLVSTENPYRFDCEGDAQYEVRFEEITYTITLSAGEGGTVSPSGEQSVKAGEDLAVTITANEGYVIEDVLVDGQSVGARESYTFETVTADHSLEATFKPDVANESEDKAGLHVYPNPYAEELHVESAWPMESIRILDLQGRETVRYELNGQQAVSLRPVLPEGLYLLVVEQANGQTAVHRIVKSEKR